MHISKIETIRFSRGITVHDGRVNWLWVRIHTDEGTIGLGEAYPVAEAAETVIAHSLAEVLLGIDPREIDRLWADMLLTVGYHGWVGSEMRAISAIDIALWDLLGMVTGQSVYQLLGGKSHERIRIYNTGYDHVNDFNQESGRLAEDLLATGVRAMKIWSFDTAALRNQGQFITPAALQECLKPVQQTREAVGDSMEIAMEFHGYWKLPSAIRIAQALEPYSIVRLEEMLLQDNMQAYRQLARETRIPLCLSERLMTRYQFREVVEQGIARFVMPDICGSGGILGSQEDCGTSRDALSAHRAPQLPWSDSAIRIHASRHERHQPVYSRKHAAPLSERVRRHRHQHRPFQRRLVEGTVGIRAEHRPASFRFFPSGCGDSEYYSSVAGVGASPRVCRGGQSHRFGGRHLQT
ncbi:MAG: mandelate racemase/muconate lactonizing enzyme family protein [Acidobacteria bacterium]|nr:mandelate racemase/muconate lactonizing enzyme family protein [Acidobacteriota bacterium]